jgi:hypothetical protein
MCRGTMPGLAPGRLDYNPPEGIRAILRNREPGPLELTVPPLLQLLLVKGSSFNCSSDISALWSSALS